ncbi:MAG: TauD/TfdA family dioxygenase [Rhodospirillaceae bacterium]|jgi:taurine dioxygenase|nr:TauD/TfdA family dioxygenase [Rhodospirillaceae bacterium]
MTTDFTLTDLTPFMGAEVHGVDLGAAMPDATFGAIKRALAERSVLLFRNQDMTPESQIAFSARFGELEKHVLQNFCLDGHPEIFVVSNIIEDGKHIGAFGGSKEFHSDLAYIPDPSKGSVFRCLECPEGEGETEFVSMFAALDALPEEKRDWLSQQSAVFDYVWDYSRRQTQRPPLSEEQIRNTPPVTHPCVRSHPETGRKTLFVSPIWIRNFVGMSEEDSQPILKELTDFATGPDFAYRHSWRAGDVLVWDNRSTLHKACPFDEENSRRLMHRTTITGEQTIR